jgi:predicted DNA-binding transcriptional regulator AlpA
MDSDLYNTDDVVAKFSITKRTLSDWIKQGKLPLPIRIGRRLLWKRKTIDDLVDKLEKEGQIPK